MDPEVVSGIVTEHWRRYLFVVFDGKHLQVDTTDLDDVTAIIRYGIWSVAFHHPFQFCLIFGLW